MVGSSDSAFGYDNLVFTGSYIIDADSDTIAYENQLVFTSDGVGVVREKRNYDLLKISEAEVENRPITRPGNEHCDRFKGVSF